MTEPSDLPLAQVLYCLPADLAAGRKGPRRGVLPTNCKRNGKTAPDGGSLGAF